MINVIAIAGETYDLDTGKETPKAIILSNGIRSISLEVEDNVIKEIILLDAEARNSSVAHVAKKVKKVKAVSEPEEPCIQGYPTPDPQMVDPLGETSDVPPDEDPGISYMDTDTGVASI